MGEPKSCHTGGEEVMDSSTQITDEQIRTAFKDALVEYDCGVMPLDDQIVVQVMLRLVDPELYQRVRKIVKEE